MSHDNQSAVKRITWLLKELDHRLTTPLRKQQVWAEIERIARERKELEAC